MIHTDYIEIKKLDQVPRLPIKGNIDLTYRCNNNCRHCWLRIPKNSKEKNKELTFEEIKKIVNEAKVMGCRGWSISGGEPLLRPEFADIFDYITSRSNSYSINTNGTLITPKIARLLKKKGSKMIALYGADAKIHDHITRTPGSFKAAMRGIAYLKEEKAGFTVQIIPMKDNYHQFNDMVKLAESLSKHYRIGAPWLYLSACGDNEKNKEILRQRLSPKEVVELDKPDLSYEDRAGKLNPDCGNANENGYLFSSCINSRRDFHIDPYGGMTFCCFIKDPALRYDLKKGCFEECWEKFIPSLASKVKTTEEYKKHCGSCELRKNCRWCPVYSYLEHRKFDSKIDHLCAVSKENLKFKEGWKKNHRRHYKVAGISIQVDSDLPINDNTFDPKFKDFEVKNTGEDSVSIRHHFSLPDISNKDLGKELYRKPPWAIYKKGDSWIYLGIAPSQNDKSLHRIAVFNSDHTRVKIYNAEEGRFLKGNQISLTLFPTDQILLARILADREGCYIHSCGVDLQGKGILFVGHSEAGKSTIANILKDKAKILCDDRIIVRNSKDGFNIHGTWSHGDVPEISADSAPLKAIMFLKQSKENRITPLKDKKEISKKLLSCVIRPFVTVDWWEKTISIVAKIAEDAPCYTLEFDKSGKITEELKNIR